MGPIVLQVIRDLYIRGHDNHYDVVGVPLTPRAVEQDCKNPALDLPPQIQIYHTVSIHIPDRLLVRRRLYREALGIEYVQPHTTMRPEAWRP